MKLSIPAGTVSFITHIFALDASDTSGGGKTALVYSDITAYYVRPGGTLTALTMVDVTTLGTWDTDVTSDKLGFKLLNDTNAPGLYEIHLPNNILAPGAGQVVIMLRATDMAPVLIEIQLTTGVLGGVVDTASFTPTATQFESDTITEATNDHYKGRIIIFMSGVLVGQASDITAYSKVGSNGRFTVTAMTEAPGDNDTFIIV